MTGEINGVGAYEVQSGVPITSHSHIFTQQAFSLSNLF